MRLVTQYLCTLALTSLSLAAHADTIDDFVFTGNSHTIAYSLPATSSFPDFDLLNTFTETAPATIDGVSGYSVFSQYNVSLFQVPFDVVLSVPTSIFGNSSLTLDGPPLFSYVFVSANNPFPYLPYNLVTTFIPGTYTLSSAAQPFFPSVTYTLTITPESTPSSVPEPSTLVLLATGTLGLLMRSPDCFRRKNLTTAAM